MNVRTYFQKSAPVDFLSRCRPVTDVHPAQRTKLTGVLKAMVGAGCAFNAPWVAQPTDGKTNWHTYWEGGEVTLPDGTHQSARALADRLQASKAQETIAPVDAAQYTFTPNGADWRITGPAGEWTVEAKLALNEAALHHLLNLLVAFVPSGKSVSLQADSHQAGNCWVGLVCVYDEARIPFVPISADIGCGMCLLPLVKDGVHVNGHDLSPPYMEALQVRVLLTARAALQRGKAAEKGSAAVPLVDEVLQFLDREHERDAWVEDLRRLFQELDIAVPGGDVLAFAMGFGMTLGSSGNHFLELNQGDDGRLYLVIHSGSRGLGAMVYHRISQICCTLYGVNAVAVGKYAALYNLAYSALNNFAVINRLLCGICVLRHLGCTHGGAALKDHMVHHTPLFADLAHQPDQVGALLRGVTHNGMKCFVDHAARRKIFVMCKGAIAISARASCGIVALRAGEGVVVMTFLDATAQWVECDLRDVGAYADYTAIHDIGATDILLMGHGAGRSTSTTATWKASEYAAVLAYYRQHGIVGGLSPGVLGDNPVTAYKPVQEVRRHLPEGRARAVGWLRTLVNHKEGIDHRPQWWGKFVDFVLDAWPGMADVEKVMCDLILVRRGLQDRGFDAMWAEQQRLAEGYGVTTFVQLGK